MSESLISSTGAEAKQTIPSTPSGVRLTTLENGLTLIIREDHSAPADSVLYGSQFFGGPVKYVLSGSGHIAGVVNPPSKPKYQYWTGGKPSGSSVDDWLKNATEHPGSWWPD